MNGNTNINEIDRINGDYQNIWIVLGSGYRGRGIGAAFLPNAQAYNITLLNAYDYNGGAQDIDITSHITVENRGYSINVSADSGSYNGHAILIGLRITPK